MNKLSELFKKIAEKWKSISKSKKIAYSILFAVVVVSLIYLAIVMSSTKYDVLFSNMSTEDSGAIVNKLKEQKVQYKIQGNSILVPKEQVDSLRMELLSSVQLTQGSKGFELFDNGKMAPTDQETKIMYQRALSGEIERTIKSFPEVEGVKVNLVLPENTAFVKETDPARASVTLKLKQGLTMSKDQVKAIVSLLTGSVENLPKENVTIVSDKMQLLTDKLYDDEKDSSDGVQSADETDKQQQIKSKIEKDLEKKIMNVLQPIYKDGVKVSVSADVNFDAVQQESVKYDPQGTVVSMHEKVDSTGNGQTSTSESPVDNNMSNTTATANNGNIISRDTTKNFEISKTQEKTLKAPGQVKRVSASVVLDGDVNEDTKTAVNNLVAKAIAYSADRGDSISVEGIPFNKDAANSAKEDLEKMKQDAENAKRQKMYTGIGIAVAAILLLLISIVAIKKSSKKEKGDYDDLEESQGIDMLIDDEIEPKEKEHFEAIDFEHEDQKSHLEKEIRKYATDKPDQVADIIKSWLTEDER